MIASIFVNKVLDLFLPPHIGLVRLTESTLMVSCSITSKLSVLQNSIQQTPYLTYFHFIGSDPTYPLPAAFLPSFQKQAVPNSTSGSYCFLDDRSTVPWSVPHSARSWSYRKTAIQISSWTGIIEKQRYTSRDAVHHDCSATLQLLSSSATTLICSLSQFSLKYTPFL